MKPVAIIGGGITGLVAAFRLQQKNIPFRLYEAGERVGGVIQSVRENGYLAEFGPNTLLDTSPKINEVINAAELTPRRWYSQDEASNRYLVRYRRPIAMPGGLFGFLKTPLFSANAKWKLFKEPFIPPWNNAHEESVAEFVLRRLGSEFLDYAINPMVAGIFAGDPARLSVIHAFPKLYDVEQKYGSLIKGQILGARERKKRAEVSKQNAKKISFDEGLQVLPEGLYQHIKAHTLNQAKVLRISKDPEGWQVTYLHQSEERVENHSVVLYTGTAYQLANLELNSPEPVDLSVFKDVRYPPVTSVVLGFRREDVKHPLDGFGMLIPKCEGFKILGTLFSSSLFPKRAPEGHVTLTSYVGGERDPELALKPFDQLIDVTHRDLRELLGITGKPTFQHCVFYPKAIPQYEVGYGRFKERMDQVERQAPGVFVAGHFRTGISLSDSMVAGYNAADLVERHLQRAGSQSNVKEPNAAHC